MNRVRVTWKKSAIGYGRDQLRVVKALGLRALNQTVEHDSTPQVLGMIRKVSHLVEVEEINREGAR